MINKVYCERCLDFTPHDFRRWPFCIPCRGRGSPVRVAMIMVVCIGGFIIAVAKIAGYL